MRRVAFVSGASRGIGRAIARTLAENGFFVCFTYHKNKALADSLLEEIKHLSDGVCFCCDFSNLNAVRALALQISECVGPIDLLVNNAGISSYGLLQDVTEEEYDRAFSVNFKSHFFLTKAFVGPMISSKRGCIVNVSSIWGQTGASCEVLYSATKSAMIGFTKALAKELGPSGIRVNCIAPGVVDTDMMASFSIEEKRAISEEIPLGRFCDPEEIASLVLFLSEHAPGITGQVFAVNGGQYC